MTNITKSVIATQDGTLIFEFIQEGVPHAVMQEKHSLKIQTSTYPVETRQTITDHAIVNPMTLNLKGIVSNIYQPRKFEAPSEIRILYGDEPLNARIPSAEKLATFNRSVRSKSKGPRLTEEAWLKMVQLTRERRLMDIYTPLGAYSRMLIVSLEALRDKNSGLAYSFDIDFQEEVIWQDELEGQGVVSNTGQVSGQAAPLEGNVMSEEVDPDLGLAAVAIGELTGEANVSAVAIAALTGNATVEVANFPDGSNWIP